MTDLLSRLASSERAGLERGRWQLVTGAGAALAAAGVALAGLSAVTVLLRALAPHADGAVLEPARAAGLAWLLAHRVGIGTASGELSLAPLALTVPAVLAAFHAAAWAARAVRADDARSLAVTTAGFAAAYGVLAGAVAGAVGGDAFRPRLLQALGLGCLIAAVAGGLGGLWSAGLLNGLMARLPSAARPALLAGGAGVLVLFGGGALVTALSLALHGGQASTLFAAVAGGWAGALGVLVVCVAYLPNAAIWAASFAAGPGFAVGEGTHVALGGVQLGAAPALPLLAALPGSGPAPLPSYAALVVPVAAGVVTGLVAERRTRELPLTYAGLCAMVAGVGAGALTGALAWLSTGSAGGRLSALGPTAWLTGLAVAAEFAVLAPGALMVARWWGGAGRGD